MSENNIQGNGNWYLTDGKWVSDEGQNLSVADAFASGNPPDGYIPENVAGRDLSFGSGDGSNGGNPFNGNPFMGGTDPNRSGNLSTTSEDGQYIFNYTRTADERSSTLDANNPFAQLLNVVGVDSNSLASGNNPFGGGMADNNTPNTDNQPQLGGGNNPFLAGGGNLPSTNDSVLPEAPEGLSVPYNSDNWISDLTGLESGEPGASSVGNTGSGNGNWFYGSNNTANGNGNWYFSDGNTNEGNGNWNFGSGNTTDGNGNWNFGSDNTSNGNGNWQVGYRNTIDGNGNRLSGSGNNVLGNANTSDVRNSSFLGNSIEATEDGTYIGNEDWSFNILESLDSTTMGVSGIGNDVRNLVNDPDLTSTAMSKEGYSNSEYLMNQNYQFSL